MLICDKHGPYSVSCLQCDMNKLDEFMEQSRNNSKVPVDLEIREIQLNALRSWKAEASDTICQLTEANARLSTLIKASQQQLEMSQMECESMKTEIEELRKELELRG
jgi:hypothetical protein